MKVNKIKLFLMGCMASLTITSCTSSEDPAENAGSGSIRLGLTTSTVFTKAVNESDYGDINKYSVQILNDKGTTVEEFIYSEKPERISLNNGNYTLKAFYGTESDASRDEFYVEGETGFTVNGEELQEVAVECKPTCGKVKVSFANNMSQYFSNYSVVYETAALKETGSSAIWQKTIPSHGT